HYPPAHSFPTRRSSDLRVRKKERHSGSQTALLCPSVTNARSSRYELMDYNADYCGGNRIACRCERPNGVKWHDHNHALRPGTMQDRKSTRLKSSHVKSS